MSLTEPIVEGAWYLLEENFMAGQALQCGECGTYRICGFEYRANGDACLGSPRKIRQVHLVPTDPAEVVAELRRKHQEAQRSLTGFPTSEYFTGLRDGHEISADLVAAKLGVK